MAHFAELDENNIVKQVIVVHNNELIDEDGQEVEAKGIAFCQSLFGSTWAQTSYNSKFRKNYAGIGYVYDEQRDAFIEPKPDDFIDEEGNSFTYLLNEETCQWEAVEK